MAAAKPTQEQIDTEVRTLREMKPTVRRTNSFGDSHHDAIDAQIHVLEKNLGDSRIYSEYGDESADEFAQNVLDEALHARNWMDGDEPSPPSESWKELVQ